MFDEYKERRDHEDAVARMVHMASKLVTGFKNHGFPDVGVTASPSRASITIPFKSLTGPAILSYTLVAEIVARYAKTYPSNVTPGITGWSVESTSAYREPVASDLVRNVDWPVIGLTFEVVGSFA